MTPFSWLAAGSALALVVVVAIWQVQVSRLEATHFRAISAEQQKTRDVQGQFDGYKLQVEQTISNNARQHATELQEALDAQEVIAAETDRLRAANAASTKERDSLSRELLRRLNDAPKDVDSRLDARTRAHYQRLREQQLAARAGSDPPAP